MVGAKTAGRADSPPLSFPLLPHPLAAGCNSKSHRYPSNFFLGSWQWANECSARPLQQCAHLRAPLLHDPWRKVVALGEMCFEGTGAVEEKGV